MSTGESLPATVGAALATLRKAFRAAALGAPDLDARLLVGGVLGLDATGLLLTGTTPLSQSEARQIEAAMIARLSGRPVHRILGARDFYGLSLHLSPETLEPRPDTETLVDAALAHVEAVITAKGWCHIADLGVGTGAIGLALLSSCPKASCFGVDISAGAVAVALDNAHRLGLSDRYQAVIGDWFDGVDRVFDVIVSNPPYIRSGDLGSLSIEVRQHDPLAALDGGADGLDPYRVISRQAGHRLDADGVLLVEIGQGQGFDIRALFDQAGWRNLSIHSDLAGIDRVLVFARG